MQEFRYPFDTGFPLAQGFGDNRHMYAPFGLDGHNGADYSTPEGTPVRAMHDGTIVFAGDGVDSAVMGAAAGTCVLLKSTDGTYCTGYAHLLRAYGESGTQIKAGDTIAISGNSGFTSGPHTHIEFLPLPLALDNGFMGRAPFPEGAGGLPEYTPLPAKVQAPPAEVEATPAKVVGGIPVPTTPATPTTLSKPKPRPPKKASRGE